MTACHCCDNPALTPLCICDTESVSDSWLRAHNTRLGAVPADLIRDGQAAKVVKEARRHNQ